MKHKQTRTPEMTTPSLVRFLSLAPQAHGFTKSAVEAIEAKGGKCQLLSPTTNEVVVMDEDDEE